MSHLLRKISPLLQVKDLAASFAFYGTLGFHEVYRREGFLIVARDGCEVYLAQKQREADLRNVTARSHPDAIANYDLHFDCELDASDRLWSEFRAAGVQLSPEFEHGPVNRSYGIRDFSVIDPDGYILVFGSPIEDK